MKLDNLGFLSESTLKIIKTLLEEETQYINSEEVGNKTGLKGQKLGSALSALSKIKLTEESLLIPWGRKSMRLKRERKGKLKDVPVPVQVWKINQEIYQNKDKVLNRINEILEVLKE